MKNPFAKISFFLILLLAGLTAAAQDDDWDFEEESGDKGGKISGIMLHVPIGYQSMDLSPLNSGLVGNSDFTEGFSSDRFTLGIGGTFIVRNLVLTVGMSNSLVERIESPTTEGRYDLRLRRFGIGYNVFSRRGLIIYPTAHIGLYNHNLVLAGKTADDGTNGVFSGDYTGTDLGQRGLYAGAELSIDYMTGYDEQSGAGITFGLKVGYNAQLSADNWQSYGTSVGGTPELDISGAYARFCIAFAGWHRQ